MSIQHKSKLQTILANWPSNTVALASWFGLQGVSPQLVRRYVESGWIEPIGQGAYKRPHEKVEWSGALFTLQTQAKIVVHLGGSSALAFHGASHYVRSGKETIFLFSPLKIHLPKWFTAFSWDQPLAPIRTIFLPDDLGVSFYSYHEKKIRIATVERAILECLYLSPKQVDLLECYRIAQGLQGLRPKLMQSLLEVCTSIKVKRLFLFMAEKANLPVMRHLKLENIDLGRGDRSIVQHGEYNGKYGLILPKELLNDDKPTV